jgi:hypothetical protein
LQNPRYHPSLCTKNINELHENIIIIRKSIGNVEMFFYRNKFKNKDIPFTNYPVEVIWFIMLI